MDLLALATGTLLGAWQAASSLPPEPQDPDRPRVSLRDFKGLRENNVFAPARPPRRESRTPSPSSAPPAPPPPPAPLKPRTPVVTGIVYSEEDQAWQVLVEDRNDDLKLKLFAQPRFLKAGEEFLGYVVESVTEGTVAVRVGETVRELGLGDSFPERLGTPPVPKGETAAPTGERPETAPAAEGAAPPVPEGKPGAISPVPDDEARRKVLEELKKKYRKTREDLDFQEP